jgi:hypothetical protein
VTPNAPVWLEIMLPAISRPYRVLRVSEIDRGQVTVGVVALGAGETTLGDGGDLVAGVAREADIGRRQEQLYLRIGF